MLQAGFLAIILFSFLFTNTYAADSTAIPVPSSLQPVNVKQTLAGGTTQLIGPNGGVDSQTIQINGSCVGQPQGKPEYLVSIFHTDEPGNTDISCNMRSIKNINMLTMDPNSYDPNTNTFTKWSLLIQGEIQTSTLSGCNNQPFQAYYLVYCPQN